MKNSFGKLVFVSINTRHQHPVHL